MWNIKAFTGINSSIDHPLLETPGHLQAFVPLDRALVLSKFPPEWAFDYSRIFLLTEIFQLFIFALPPFLCFSPRPVSRSLGLSHPHGPPPSDARKQGKFLQRTRALIHSLKWKQLDVCEYGFYGGIIFITILLISYIYIALPIYHYKSFN